MLFPEVTPIFPTEIATYKGYINVQQSRDQGWYRKWIAIRRPYIVITDHERDPVIRTIIHLNDIKVQYSEDQVGEEIEGRGGGGREREGGFGSLSDTFFLCST